MERNDRIEEELFPFYALDALTDEERAEVEAYVAGNPEARARLDEALEGAAALAMTAAPLAPSPEVKARLMARVDADLALENLAAPRRAAAAPPRPPAPATRRFSLGDFFLGRSLGFAALLILLGAFGLWRLWQQSGDLRAQLAAQEARTAALQAELDQLRTDNAALREELATREEILARFQQPGAVTFTLGDPAGERPAAGTITTHSDSGEMLLTVANLPPPPPGTTYQAWLIVGETPVSAGTFAVDENGRGIHEIPDAPPGSFDAVGVSLEPAGGSQQPTPENIVLVGAGT